VLISQGCVAGRRKASLSRADFVTAGGIRLEKAG
jgi:hypothetical protein